MPRKTTPTSLPPGSLPPGSTPPPLGESVPTPGSSKSVPSASKARPLIPPTPSKGDTTALLNPNPGPVDVGTLGAAFLEAVWETSKPTEAIALYKAGLEAENWPLDLQDPPTQEELLTWYARVLWGSLQSGRLRGDRLSVSETLKMIQELRGLLQSDAVPESPPVSQTDAFPFGLTPL